MAISMPLRGRKAIYGGIVFLALTLVLWRLHSEYMPKTPVEKEKVEEPPPPPPPPPLEIGQHYPPQNIICQSNLDWLKELDIPFPVKYARRDIHVRSDSTAQRLSVTKINEPLLGDFQVVDPHKQDNRTASGGIKDCMPPLTLSVPAYSKQPPDASHILFGAASNLDRLEASISFFERWLAHTGARLFIIISGPDDKTRPDLTRMSTMQTQMRSLGMNVTLIEPPSYTDTFVQRYFSLVNILYENRLPTTKWLVFIDDDTFIVSMSALTTALSHYNPTEPHYLGTLSEEWWTVVLYGLIGMGGGGIFLTLPLASTLHTNYKNCHSDSRMTFGDHKIYECIARHSPTRLEQLPGLYQIDIHGDRSGIFESGRQILSLHHWKEGYWSEDGAGADAIRHSKWFPMDEMALVGSEICDRCYLQRFQFSPDTILVPGYSISTYPTGFLSLPDEEKRLDQMEETWVTPVVVEGSGNGGWDHYVGPLRRKLELEVEKVPWRFLRGVRVQGGVREYYRHIARGEGEVDGVVELFWRREEDVGGG
ncbi:hypothetical protein ACLMJK_009332 [Lecanora helva]